MNLSWFGGCPRWRLRDCEKPDLRNVPQVLRHHREACSLAHRSGTPLASRSRRWQKKDTVLQPAHRSRRNSCQPRHLAHTLSGSKPSLGLLNLGHRNGRSAKSDRCSTGGSLSTQNPITPVLAQLVDREHLRANDLGDWTQWTDDAIESHRVGHNARRCRRAAGLGLQRRPPRPHRRHHRHPEVHRRPQKAAPLP